MKTSILLLTLLPTFLFGQSVFDTTTFSNVSEQQYFQQFSDDHAFELLFHIENDQQLEHQDHLQQFYAFLDVLTERLDGKKTTKKVVKIYDAIHEAYFTKYIENPNFFDIFTRKHYNCVTATALYALAFDYLHIPYQIKEQPTHVYLVVHPESVRIVLEPTLPSNGYLSINNEMLNRQKQYLVQNKLISKNEAANMSNEELFSQFIFTDNNISLKELIGVQYYNTSVRFAEQDQMQAALNQIEKAKDFYTSEYVKTWRNFLLLDALEEENLSTDDFCYLVSSITNENVEKRVLREGIFDLFTSRIEEMIAREDDVSSLKSLTQCVTTKIQDSTLTDEYHYRASLLIAQYHYQLQESFEALEILAEVYRPKRQRLHIYIAHCLSQHFETIRDGKTGLDSLSKYEAIFPFVKEDAVLQEFGTWCYMNLLYQSFELNDPVEGEKWLEQFRSKYAPDAKIAYRPGVIGNGYGAASSYCVRQQDYAKARAYLQEGLRYTPQSVELKKKLGYLEGY